MVLCAVRQVAKAMVGLVLWTEARARKAVARELVCKKAHSRSRGRLGLRSLSSVKAEARVDSNRAEGTGGSEKGITP